MVFVRVCCTLYTLHYTLYTIHYTLYTIHYTLYTKHYTLYTIHYTLYTIHYTLYTIHYTLYTIHYTLYTRVTSNTISLIDLLYIQNDNLVSEFGTLHKIADHDGILVCFDV